LELIGISILIYTNHKEKPNQLVTVFYLLTHSFDSLRRFRWMASIKEPQ
jgi:hypothetical protein